MKLGTYRYLMFLAGVLAVVWIWAAINPTSRRDWMLENMLVVAAVPLVFFAGKYFRLSNISYTLLAVFMTLHLVGSHYTYAEVPVGQWLQNWIGVERNMYDRIVHFSFGLLIAYPVREVFLRLAKVKGFWGYYLPLDLTLALSAGFEIGEWLILRMVDPETGAEYLGAQGDAWDAHKDMLVAGTGALIAMLITAIINIKLNPHFWREMRSSFHIPPDDQPLGEVKLKKLMRKQ